MLDRSLPSPDSQVTTSAAEVGTRNEALHNVLAQLLSVLTWRENCDELDPVAGSQVAELCHPKPRPQRRELLNALFQRNREFLKLS